MNNKTVFITGASSGIGFELALYYASKGANVALLDLDSNAEALERVRACSLSTGQAIEAYQCNVTDADGLAHVLTQASKDLGLPELAINCAGVVLAKRFVDSDQASFENLIQVNLFGSRNFAAACIPLLKRSADAGGRSQLVFISSMAGIVGNFGYSAYCSSKFGVLGLAEALRIELAPEGLEVRVVCPTEIDTPMVREERKTIHPVTLKLKKVGGLLTVEEAVNGIVSGIAGRGFFIVPGKMAKVTYWIKRLVPNYFSQMLVDYLVRKELAKM